MWAAKPLPLGETFHNSREDMDPAEESLSEYMEPARRVQLVDTLESELDPIDVQNENDTPQVSQDGGGDNGPPLIVIENGEQSTEAPESRPENVEQDSSAQGNDGEQGDRVPQGNPDDTEHPDTSTQENGGQSGDGEGEARDTSGQAQRRGNDPPIPPRSLKTPTPPLPTTPHPGGLPPIHHLTLAEKHILRSENTRQQECGLLPTCGCLRPSLRFCHLKS